MCNENTPTIHHTGMLSLHIKTIFRLLKRLELIKVYCTLHPYTLPHISESVSVNKLLFTLVPDLLHENMHSTFPGCSQPP